MFPFPNVLYHPVSVSPKGYFFPPICFLSLSVPSKGCLLSPYLFWSSLCFFIRVFLSQIASFLSMFPLQELPFPLIGFLTPSVFQRLCAVLLCLFAYNYLCLPSSLVITKMYSTVHYTSSSKIFKTFNPSFAFTNFRDINFVCLNSLNHVIS